MKDITNIKLDHDVVSRDGETVGHVDRVILHPDSMEFAAIVVKEGVLFTEDRIIETEFIDHIDEDGNVHLTITQDREEDLPRFAEKRFVEPTHEQRDAIDNIGIGAGAGAGGRALLVSRSTTAEGSPAPESMMDVASPNPPPIQQQSNLPPGTVMVTEGTDVIDSAGEKIGTVSDIAYDEEGEIVSFVVEEGLIFKSHVRVPAEWITATTHDHIQIDRSAEQAEAAGRSD